MDVIHHFSVTADGKMLAEISAHKIEFRHPRCGASMVLSLGEFRQAGQVRCEVCGAVLGIHAAMVSELQRALTETDEIDGRRDRIKTRRHLWVARERLLKG